MNTVRTISIADTGDRRRRFLHKRGYRIGHDLEVSQTATSVARLLEKRERAETATSDKGMVARRPCPCTSFAQSSRPVAFASVAAFPSSDATFPLPVVVAEFGRSPYAYTYKELRAWVLEKSQLASVRDCNAVLRVFGELNMGFRVSASYTCSLE